MVTTVYKKKLISLFFERVEYLVLCYTNRLILFLSQSNQNKRVLGSRNTIMMTLYLGTYENVK